AASLVAAARSASLFTEPESVTTPLLALILICLPASIESALTLACTSPATCASLRSLERVHPVILLSKSARTITKITCSDIFAFIKLSSFILCCFIRCRTVFLRVSKNSNLSKDLQTLNTSICCGENPYKSIRLKLHSREFYPFYPHKYI